MSTILVTEWLGSALGLTGAFLLATDTRVSRWGWVAFLASNLAWIAYSQLVGAHGLLTQQIGFTATSLLGIWRWILKDAIRGLSAPRPAADRPQNEVM